MSVTELAGKTCEEAGKKERDDGGSVRNLAILMN